MNSSWVLTQPYASPDFTLRGIETSCPERLSRSTIAPDFTLRGIETGAPVLTESLDALEPDFTLRGIETKIAPHCFRKNLTPDFTLRGIETCHLRLDGRGLQMPDFTLRGIETFLEEADFLAETFCRTLPYGALKQMRGGYYLRP